MMNLRPALSIFYSVLMILLTGCDANTAATHYTIGVVNFAESMEIVLQGFQDGLAQSGYVEGENVTYIYQRTENDFDRLLAVANDLVAQEVDLIIALATPSALAAQQATAGTAIPVLFMPINDPIASGLVESLSRTGGNLTGIRVGGFIPKQMEWLQRILPDVQTLFYPYNPNDDSSVISLEQVIQSAEILGLTVISPQVTSPAAVLEAFGNIPPEVDALFIAGDAMILSQIGEIIDISKAQKLPLATFILQHVEVGAFFSYGFEFYPVGEQAARLGVQLLEGIKPGDLPVETADFMLSINLATADELGIVVAEDILRQANNIIRE